MRTKKYIFILILIFPYLLAACSNLFNPQHANDVLLADDFSDEKHDWKTYEGLEDATVTYYQGGLLILLNAEQSTRIATVSGYFPNVKISTTTEKVTGTDNNIYGIVCRYSSDINYYGFLITSDGYYGIFKVHDGEYYLLNDDQLQYSESIHQGDTVNQLEANCNNNDLLLSVNGRELMRVSDNTFTNGKTGLFAGTYEEKGTAILFDNYVVLVP